MPVLEVASTCDYKSVVCLHYQVTHSVLRM